MRGKTILKLTLSMAAAICICSGCGKKAANQTADKDGMVTMSAAVTEDDSTTVICTIFNKTKKDIVIGEKYSLQVLKDKFFIDVPLLPEAGAFNLSSTEILAGEEYRYKAYIETNYGDLEAGHYRIVKEYTSKEKEKNSQATENNSTEIESDSQETVTAEFDLP